MPNIATGGDNLDQTIINQLRAKGMQFAKGLTKAEIHRIEEIYDIRFPESLRRFYGIGVPFSEDEHEFPRWADFSETNIEKIKERIQAPLRRLLNDVKGGFWLPSWGKRPESAEKAIKQFTESAMTSPRLIPVYSHRYMPCLDGVPDPPVISTVGRDTIFYGSNLQEYWRNEFRDNGEEFIVSQNRLHIPFWSDIISSMIAKMDKLTFKKKIGRTDPKMVGVAHEYILAETIINDRPFLDYFGHIEKAHEYDDNIAKRLYFELIGESDSYSHWPDGWPGKNRVVLLVCGICFTERDNPLIFAFEETDTTVVWSGFHNDQTKRNYIEIPAFRFEKEQYKAAMAQLKIIADEEA